MSDAPAQMRERLAQLAPTEVVIEDDSGLHAGHRGNRGGGHYRLIIVSAQFAGLSTLARHRLIHAALGDLMGGAIHALAIRASAPDEVQPSA